MTKMIDFSGTFVRPSENEVTYRATQRVTCENEETGVHHLQPYFEKKKNHENPTT